MIYSFRPEMSSEEREQLRLLARGRIAQALQARGRRIRNRGDFQTARMRKLARNERFLAREAAKIFAKQGDIVNADVAGLHAARLIALSPEKISILGAERQLDSGDLKEIRVIVNRANARTRGDWDKGFRSQMSATMKQSGRKLNSGIVDFGAKIDFKIFNKEASKFLDDHLPKLVDEVERRTLESVSGLAKRGIEEGHSVIDTAQEIRKLFEGMETYRAERIARTETGIASGKGENITAESVDLDLVKMWCSAEDEKVRESHLIDGEWVEFDEPFSNGILYPLDPEGPPEEIINCRCVCMYIPRDELDNWV